MYVCILITQSCLIICDPMDCSPRGSSVHGIFQARVLEWVVISFCTGSSRHRNRTRVSCIAGGFFTNWATMFPAISVNKDVTIINDFSLPNVKFWAVRAPRKEWNTCPPGVIRLQPLPRVSTEELRMWKNPGYWPQIAEMHMKGMISVSPDSWIFPYIEKN